MSFSLNEFIISVPKDKNESKEHHISRGYFVVGQLPKSKKEYKEAIKYSRIYHNVKYLKCKYDDVIMTKLKKMETKIFTKE